MREKTMRERNDREMREKREMREREREREGEEEEREDQAERERGFVVPQHTAPALPIAISLMRARWEVALAGLYACAGCAAVPQAHSECRRR